MLKDISLINLICRFYDFQGGRVVLDGMDIATLEATSFLDSESESIIIEAMGSAFRDLTRIIIYVLDGGRLVQQGRHAEFAAEEGLYRNLCGEQFISGENGGEAG